MSCDLLDKNQYAVRIFVVHCIKASTLPDQWHWGQFSSYLSRSFGFVVVIVGGHTDVFMDAVQQPQEELQSVVLGITPKLWSILGHYSLERGDRDLMKQSFFSSYTIMTCGWLSTFYEPGKRFQCSNTGGVKLWLHRKTSRKSMNIIIPST